MFKRICIFLIIFILLVPLAACGAKNQEITTDIITLKEEPADKTSITILVKYAFSINAFEQEVEKRFPKLNLIQVGNYTPNMGIAEYEARLKNDDLTDIVITWPLDVGKEYWSQRLLDLSGQSFTKEYKKNAFKDISSGQDGKVYYLPGPSQIRGIVYNKTMFNDKGWKVPNNFEEFVLLCKTIENSGIRALQLGFKDPEVLDTAFVGYGYEDCYSSPQNASAIAAYNNGTGSFADNYLPALNTFQRLIDEGIIKQSDLQVGYSDREKALFTRQCAMIEDSVLLTKMGSSWNNDDEFALMPFFSPNSNNDWARLYPVCFIGANKHLAESKNKAKYDLVMQILNYISTPEGQIALSADTEAVFSSLNGVPAPDIPAIENLTSALNSGRYGVFPTLKNAQSALRTGLTKMLNNEMNAQQVIELVDKKNLLPPPEAIWLTSGTATKNFSLTQTGNYVTDVMRANSGCDIALFLDNGKDGKFNGKGISGKFYKGDITPQDLTRILPDYKSGDTGELWNAMMTGENIVNALEYSITLENSSNWFYYFSGLKVEFAPLAKQGERVRKITDINGNRLVPSKLYSVCILNNSVADEYIESYVKTGKTIYNVLESAIVRAKTISPSNDNRFVIRKD